MRVRGEEGRGLRALFRSGWARGGVNVALKEVLNIKCAQLLV